MEAVERDDVNEAVHYRGIVRETDPDRKQISEYLKQQYLSRGMEAFMAGRLEETIASRENAVRVDPADERARGHLARASDQPSRMQRLERGTHRAETVARGEKSR